MGPEPEPIANQPLSLLDLLDGSFAALRQRARVIVAIVAGLVIPLSLFQAWVTSDDLGGATFSDIVNDPTVAEEVSDSGLDLDGGFFAAQLLGLLVTAVGGVPVSRVVGGWLSGHDTGAAEALRFTASRAGPILACFVAIHLMELIGFVLLVLPGLAVIVLSCLTSPVLALEDVGPIDAIRRSWTLVRRRPGQVIGLMLVLAMVSYGVSQAVGTLPQLVALVLGPDRSWPLVAAANMLTSIILIPVNGAAMCLIYLDIRFRTEGLDLQQRIRVAFS